MEFFQKVPCEALDLSHLKALLTIKSMPLLCRSIDNVISEQGNEAEIYCLWGAFNVRRDEIRNGIRFSLLNCPHALAWTITLKESSHQIVIHCTIDETEQDQDFIDTINEFVKDWTHGIRQALQ